MITMKQWMKTQLFVFQKFDLNYDCQRYNGKLIKTTGNSLTDFT